jgi:hypothetical protein
MKMLQGLSPHCFLAVFLSLRVEQGRASHATSKRSTSRGGTTQPRRRAIGPENKRNTLKKPTLR